MKSYKVLSKQEFKSEDYSLVPIRIEDRYDIMQWRNEQMYHLRQAEPLTKVKQDDYFENVVTKLFDQEQPNQLLFSFLKGEECIGYGGLVHIDWKSRHAEISFLLCPSFNNEKYYLNSFKEFLNMITEVAENAALGKVYTYGYDMESYRFRPLYTNGFTLEAYLHEHVLVNSVMKAVRIYSKLLHND
jgi:RimJ/RimL family protein N-acetyltransferase